MNPADVVSQDPLPLRDIHLPLTPEQWPPAPGWWMLLVIVIAIFSWVTVRFTRYWKQHRLQKEILASLDELEQYEKKQTPEFLAEVSVLLRRVAIMKFSRQQVAALTGKEWLSFLDQNGGGGEYLNGIGSVLADGPYALYSNEKSNIDRSALLLLTRKWIKHNTRT